MQSKNKTALWFLGFAVVLGTAYYFIRKKKKQGEPEIPVPPTGGGVIQNPAIGKKAVAIANFTNVRSQPVVNNGVVNNIVGVFDANQEIGVVQSVANGVDGKIWFYVKSNVKFPCPFDICGLGYGTIGIGNKEGYVRSDVVSLKL